MSLPIKAIDRLFERLALTYGAQWDRLWEGRPITDVKTLWATELSGYASENGLKAIAWALENLPERCPNAIEFRNLCRHAPMPEAKQIPAPKADPERVAAELAKLAPMREHRPAPAYDGRSWARAIIARHEAGEKITPSSLKFARDALVDRHEKLVSGAV